jgi:hypothetical protein
MEQSQNNILSLLLQLGANPERGQKALKILDASATGLEKTTVAMRAHAEEIVRTTKAQQDAVAVFSRSKAQADEHTEAIERSTLALRSQTAVGAELASKGLAGLVAGRKAQAGVEAVWETARGIAMLAEGTWPPNPAAILAAGLHFEAAAEYALLAGTGSHRRSAGGAGSGIREAGLGTREAGFVAPRPELAAGAAGASARFSGSGVVIIRGTQAFENYVASAVNGAVARGVNVTATSAQRGSPVGH